MSSRVPAPSAGIAYALLRIVAGGSGPWSVDGRRTRAATLAP